MQKEFAVPNKEIVTIPLTLIIHIQKSTASKDRTQAAFNHLYGLVIIVSDNDLRPPAPRPMVALPYVITKNILFPPDIFVRRRYCVHVNNVFKIKNIQAPDNNT